MDEPKIEKKGLPISIPTTPADQKRQLYQKVLKEEFLREMQYLWDVANDRAAARDTLTATIVGQLKKIPIPDSSIVTALEKLGDAAVFAANRIRDQRTRTIAQLKDELDLPRLTVIIDAVAREALRRYESFIVDRLSDDVTVGVIPFAKVGARRMLEYLSRTGQGETMDERQIVLSESYLLCGLVEGRSGAFVDGYTNHSLTLKQTKKNLLKKEVPRLIDAEVIYARPGFRRFELQNGALIDVLYVRENALHQELTRREKAAALSKGNTEAFYHFGQVEFRRTRSYTQDPKAGFVLMPLSVIADRYDYHPADPKQLSDTLQAELRGSSHSILMIDAVTLAAYVTASKQTHIPNILHYVHTQLKYPLIQQVICREDLSALDLKGVNLSHMDLSGAILSGDLTGTQFQDSYLVGAVFQNVTSAQGANFSKAHCQYLQAERVNFNDADLTQADFSYANLQGALMTRCQHLGTVWTEADLKNVVSDADLLKLQATQMQAFKKELLSQRQYLETSITQFQENLQAFYTAQAQWQRHITELESKAGQLDNAHTAIATLTHQVQTLLQQQADRFTFEAHCRQQIEQLQQQLQSGVDQATVEPMKQALAQVQQECLALQNATPIDQSCGALQAEVGSTLAQLGDESAGIKTAWTEFEATLSTIAPTQKHAQEERLHNLLEKLDTFKGELEQRIQALEGRVSHLEDQMADQIKASDAKHTLVIKLKKMRQRVLADSVLTEELSDYIPPNGQNHPDQYHSSHPLEAWVEAEFLQSDTRVLLLQGPAGAGKSTFNRHLFRKLWQNAAWETLSADSDPLPVFLPFFISLGSVVVNPKQLLDGLQKLPEGFTQFELKVLKEHYTILWIADGYDELPGNAKINLYDENHLGDSEGRMKLLISCRTQRLYEAEENSYFMPHDEQAQTLDHYYKRRYLAAFNENQVHDYIEAYLNKHRQRKADKEDILLFKQVAEYERTFKQFPELQSLVTTPFLLMIAIEVLPKILKEAEEVDPTPKKIVKTKQKEKVRPLSAETLKLTRVKLYEQFMDGWFYRQADKAVKSRNLLEKPEDLLGTQTVFKLNQQFEKRKRLQKISYDVQIDYLKKAYSDFSQRLAISLKQTGRSSADPRGGGKVGKLHHPAAQSMDQVDTAVYLLSDNDSDIVRCRQGSPIRQLASGEWGFIHASLIDYFAATTLGDSLTQPISAQTIERLSISLSLPPVLEPQPSSEIPENTPSLSIPSATKTPLLLGDAWEQAEKWLNQALLTREDIYFLADRVEQEPSFRIALQRVIERSKQDKQTAIAAANAISILNTARVSFSGWDLTRVAIPQADLSGALMEDTRLDGADMRGVVLQGAWLKGASLRGANLQQIRFGKLPYWDFQIRTNCAAFSEDGHHLAVSSGAEITIYNTTTRKKEAVLKGHAGTVTALAWHPFKKQLISGNQDYSILFWDLSKNEKPKSIKEQHTDIILSLAWDSVGERLASGSADGQIYIWDGETRGVLQKLVGHSEAVHTLAWHPEGTWLASAGKDRIVRIWQATSGEIVHQLKGHLKELSVLAWAPVEKRLAVASQETIYLWNAMDAEEPSQLVGHTQPVSALIWSPNGETIASGSQDQSVRIWDAVPGKELRQLTEHTQAISSLFWHKKGKYLVSCDQQGKLHIWDTTIQRELRQFKNGHALSVTQIAWSHHNSPYLASASLDKTIHIWDTQGRELKTCVGHTKEVLCLAWETIRSSSPKKSAPTLEPSETANTQILEDQPRYLASGGMDRTILIWDIETGQILKKLIGHVGEVTDLVWDPKGVYLASASRDNTVRIWELETSRLFRSFKHPQGEACQSLSWHPTAPFLAVGGETGAIIWDIQTGSEWQSSSNGLFVGEPILTIAWNPNGSLLAMGGRGGNLYLWDMTKIPLPPTKIPLMSPNAVNSLTWDIQGIHLAIASHAGNQVVIWHKEGYCVWQTVLPEKIKSLGWIGLPASSTTNQAFNFSLLAMAVGKGVACYQVKSAEKQSGEKTEHFFKPILYWYATATPKLHLVDVLADKAENLTDLNRELLKQHGARVPEEIAPQKTSEKERNSSPPESPRSPRSFTSFFGRSATKGQVKPKKNELKPETPGMGRGK